MCLTGNDLHEHSQAKIDFLIRMIVENTTLLFVHAGMAPSGMQTHGDSEFEVNEFKQGIGDCKRYERVLKVRFLDECIN